MWRTIRFLIAAVWGWGVLIVLAVALVAWLLICGGCQTASVHESYSRGQSPTSQPTQDVKRTVSATRIMTWAGSSPGETISHVNPMKVTDTGADFGGMDPMAAAARTPVFLFWAGLVVAAGGVAVLVFIPGFKSTGIIVAVIGGAMVVASIAFETYPWLALAIVGVGIVGGMVYFVFGTAAGAKVKAALANVVAGIEATKTTDPQAAKAVTANITATAGGDKTKAAATTSAVVNATRKTM